MFKKILTAAVVAGVMAGAGHATAIAAQPAAPAPAAADDTRIDGLMDEGFELMKKKEFEAAAKKFKAVLKINPKHTEALYQMAWISNELEEHDLAIKYARTLIKENPKDSDGWRELGFAQYKTEEFEDAVVSLEKAIKLNPKDVAAHEYIVAVHKALGNDDEVEAWEAKLKKAREAQKKNGKKPVLPVDPDDDN